MKLRIYDDAVAMVTEVRAYRLAIAREDADHARQLRRAAKSVPLNIAEGAYSRGRNRHSRYHTALGSANEVVACLEVAVADGILDSIDPDVLDASTRSSAPSSSSPASRPAIGRPGRDNTPVPVVAATLHSGRRPRERERERQRSGGGGVGTLFVLSSFAKRVGIMGVVPMTI